MTPGKTPTQDLEMFSGLFGQGVWGSLYLAVLQKVGQSLPSDSTLAPLTPHPSGETRGGGCGASEAGPQLALLTAKGK